MKNPAVDKLFLQIRSDMNRVLKNSPRAMARIAINFMEENFEKGGFQGEVGIKKWAPRKYDDGAGRGVLIGKQSGRLMKSGTVFQADEKATIVGVPDNIAVYGRIHNEGGTTHPKVTPAMKKFAWFKYKKTGEDRWKGLALTKKKRLDVKIPRRQFLGNSPLLSRRLTDFLRNAFQTSLKSTITFK